LVAKINQRQAGDKGPSHPVCLDFSPWGAKGRFAGQGVVYHLDECQLLYNVRKYAEAPEGMPFYLSQHRKLGDDIYVYTQKPENVDKMLRGFTQPIHAGKLQDKGINLGIRELIAFGNKMRTRGRIVGLVGK
jgi:hypothetical protein